MWINEHFTRRHAVAWGAAIATAVFGCSGRPDAPTHPSTPALSTPQFVTVGGTVIEHTHSSIGPKAGVAVTYQSQSGGSVTTTSGTDGHYEFVDRPVGEHFWIAAAFESEYRSPCPSGRAPLTATNARVDVPVVSRQVLKSDGMPPSLPINSVYSSGVIFETVAGSRHAVAGAIVDLVDRPNSPLARSSTISDFSGRYLICTVPPDTGTDTLQWLQATHPDFQPAARSVAIGWDYFQIDLEFLRR